MMNNDYVSVLENWKIITSSSHHFIYVIYLTLSCAFTGTSRRFRDQTRLFCFSVCVYLSVSPSLCFYILFIFYIFYILYIYIFCFYICLYIFILDCCEQQSRYNIWLMTILDLAFFLCPLKKDVINLVSGYQSTPPLFSLTPSVDHPAVIRL